MSKHKASLFLVGCYLETELYNYIDKVKNESGFDNRFDTLRKINREHKEVLIKNKGRKMLTFSEVIMYIIYLY